MATTQSYTPDAHRLAASLPAIYARHPATQGLAAARRITVTAAELQAAGWGNPTDPAVINTAALLLLAGPPDAANRPGVSAAIAEAWLWGAGAPGEFVAAVSDAMVGAWRELQTVAVPADQAGSAVLSNNGLLLGHAALLDLVALERHRDYLRDVPSAGSERYLSAYRQGYLIPALLLGPRLSMPAAMAMFASRMPRLAEFLDAQDAALVPTDWRRLAQVGDVQKGVMRLLAGEDPALVKSEMPPPGLPYAEYRGQQRSVIAGSHDLILNLTHDRIEASRNVAAEKYLESDTIHKPAVEETFSSAPVAVPANWGCLQRRRKTSPACSSPTPAPCRSALSTTSPSGSAGCTGKSWMPTLRSRAPKSRTWPYRRW